jgi:hypothetical protein
MKIFQITASFIYRPFFLKNKNQTIYVSKIQLNYFFERVHYKESLVFFLKKKAGYCCIHLNFFIHNAHIIDLRF